MKSYAVVVYTRLPIGTPGYEYIVQAESEESARVAALAQAKAENPHLEYFERGAVRVCPTCGLNAWAEDDPDFCKECFQNYPIKRSWLGEFGW